MREIKFRAWLPEEGALPAHMVYNPTFYKAGRFETLQAADSVSWVKIAQGALNDIFEKNPDIYFMQFTGLKDKNGKEIYEGDIVKIAAPNMDVLAEVKWDDRRAGFDHAYGEIIGNIYENPELLK